MTSNITTMTTPDAVRFRMPVGAAARLAMSSVGVAVYTKGTTVFADHTPAIRPNALEVLGTRSWSPPV